MHPSSVHMHIYLFKNHCAYLPYLLQDAENSVVLASSTIQFSVCHPKYTTYKYYYLETTCKLKVIITALQKKLYVPKSFFLYPFF